MRFASALPLKQACVALGCGASAYSLCRTFARSESLFDVKRVPRIRQQRFAALSSDRSHHSFFLLNDDESALLRQKEFWPPSRGEFELAQSKFKVVQSENNENEIQANKIYENGFIYERILSIKK